MLEAPADLTTISYRFIDLAIFKNKILVSLLGYYPTYKRQIKDGQIYSSSSGDLNSWDTSSLDHAFFFKHQEKLYAAKFKVNHRTLEPTGYLQDLKYTSDGETWSKADLKKWPKKIVSITSLNNNFFVHHFSSSGSNQDFLKKSSDGLSWKLASTNSSAVPELRFKGKLFLPGAYGTDKGPSIISE